jgi:hypothetical protein
MNRQPSEEAASGPRIAFLVYDARSGSTLLSDMLTRRLAGVYVTPEIAFIRLLKLGGRDNRMLGRTRVAQGIVSENLLRNLGIDAGELRRIVAELPEPITVSTLVRRILDAHVAQAIGGAPDCIVVKHGLHVRVCPEIAAAFGSEARFVHIYRDPRAVVSSKLRTVRPYMQQEALAWYGPLVGAWRWKDYSVRMRRAAESGVPVIDVPYEALLLEPEAQLRRIADFLGVPMRELHDVPDANYRIPHAERSIHALVQSGRVHRERADAWESELSARDLRTIEAVASAEMAVRGYVASQQISRFGRTLVILAGLPSAAWASLVHAWRVVFHRCSRTACHPG